MAADAGFRLDRIALLQAGGLFLAVLLLFGPAAGFDFVSLDDPGYVSENPATASGLSWEGVVRSFTRPASLQWVPLTSISFQIDSSLWGGSPRGFHLTNILLHALGAALFCLWLREAAGARWTGVFAAALFAFHPMRVESVAWIAERKDVLSFLFLVLTLFAYVRWQRGKGRGWFSAALVLYALGLLAKPSLIAVPFLLLALDIWPLGRVGGGGTAPPAKAPGDRPRATWGRLMREKMPFLALALAAAAVNLVRHQAGSVPGIGFLSRLDHALVAPFIYLYKSFLPFGLGLRTAGETWPAASGWGWAGGALLAALSLLAWRQRTRRPYLPAGWAWYLAALAPVSGLFPTGMFWTADRYTYLPHAGLAAALAWAGADLLARAHVALRRWGRAAALFLLLLMAFLVRHELPAWKDPRALAERSLALNPFDPVFNSLLAADLGRAGDLQGARILLDRALTRDPAFAPARYNYGLLMQIAGEPLAAAAHYRLAISSSPAFPDAYLNLADVLAASGDPAGAGKVLAAAAAMYDGLAEGELARGRLFELEGRDADAIEAYRSGLRSPSLLTQTHSLLIRRLTGKGGG